MKICLTLGVLCRLIAKGFHIGVIHQKYLVIPSARPEQREEGWYSNG